MQSHWFTHHSHFHKINQYDTDYAKPSLSITPTTFSDHVFFCITQDNHTGQITLIIKQISCRVT